VKNDSPAQPLLQLTAYRCDDCGCEVGFRSRRRTFSERYLLPVFLLQPVRCAECFRRDYRLIFIPVRERLSQASGMAPVSAVAPPRANRNVA
jgi:hypothetical protein